MKTRLRIVLLSALASGVPVAMAGGVDANAVLGGAVGGGLGAAAGSYLGGREGAIVGSAVGAAAGTAIATHDHERDRSVEGRNGREREVIYVETHSGGRKHKGCPPGLKMQGRC